MTKDFIDNFIRNEVKFLTVRELKLFKILKDLYKEYDNTNNRDILNKIIIIENILTDLQECKLKYIDCLE